MTRKERANTARESTRTTSPWRFLVAAVGALALAAAFLTFGASSASADTAPTCPATTTVDNVTTTWALVGNDCVATITTTANPTAVDADATYTCPTGYVPDGWSPPSTGTYPGNGKCVQSPAPEWTDQWTCPAGFTPDGWVSPSTSRPPNHSCVSYKTVDKIITQDATVTGWTCGSNKTIGSEIGLDPNVCYEWTHRHNEHGSWQATGVSPQPTGWSCPDGWSGPNRDHQCTTVDGTEQVVDQRRDPVNNPQCLVPADDDATLNHTHPRCDIGRANPIRTDHFFCPSDFTPTGEVAEETTCEMVETGTSQLATCPVAGDVLTNGQCVTPVTVARGGPTPVIDYCPNLEGVQWEGYDCATGIAPVSAVAPAEVVAPQAGTVSPAETVAVPKPAKVPAKAPAKATTAAPQAATVPAAVPAGGGSSSNENAPNAWLLWAALAAALVSVGATTRLVITRSR